MHLAIEQGFCLGSGAAFPMAACRQEVSDPVIHVVTN